MRHGKPTGPSVLLMVALALVLPSFAHASTQELAHLQIFVTVPATTSVPTLLDVDHVEVVGRVEAHRLRPALASLSSEELRGRTALLLDASFAPDVVDTVRIVWAGASVRIDAARTEPPLRGRSSDFVLGERIEAGTARVLHLQWDPDATDPAAEAWEPRMRVERPVRPPITAMLLVSQESSGTVAIVDRRSGVVVDAIATGGAPRGMAWSIASQRLFVGVGERNEIAVVDVGTALVTRRIPLDFGAEPTRVLLSADGARLFVLCPGRDTLVILSTASLQETGRILLPPGGTSIAEEARSGRVFVSCSRSRSIEVVDVQRATVVASLERADAPGEIVHLADEQGLAVAAQDGRAIEIVDPVTGAARTDLAVCGPVRGLAYQPRTDRLYAVLDLCREVSILRPARSIEIGRTVLPAAGGLPALDPEDRMLYVPLRGERIVFALNTSHVADTLRIETADRPYQVVVP